MRIVGIILAAVVVFLAAILVPLALTGNLNADALKRLIGAQAPAPSPVEEPEPAGPLTTKYKEEQERLRAWEAQLDEREKRLDQQELQLEEMRTEVTKIQEEVNAALGVVDQQQAEALQLTAKTMEKMDPQQAAIDLAGMKPEEAAKIAPLISDRLRGAIFDEMDPKPRAELLAAIQAKKL